MASFTTLDTVQQTVNTAAVTSSSVSWTEGRMYIAVNSVQDDVDTPSAPNMTASAVGSWTQLETVATGTQVRLTAFYWLCDGSTTGTCTSTSPETPFRNQLYIIEITPGGGESFDGTSIVQSNTNNALSASPSVTLSAFADSGNYSIGIFNNGVSNEAFTAGTDFTEQYGYELSNLGNLFEYRTQEDTTPDASVASTFWAGIGFELGFAAASTSPTDVWQLYDSARGYLDDSTILSGHTFRAALLDNTHTIDLATHSTLAHVTTDIVGTGQSLTVATSATGGLTRWAMTTQASWAGAVTPRYIVIYDDTVTSPADPLLAIAELPADQAVPAGATLILPSGNLFRR